ncbi:MAG: universal stress protein [Streptosporangiaceae bacterium]
MNARLPDDWTGGRRIVVGVDGSPNSIAALRRGAAHAAARHAELDVVHAVAADADPVVVAAGMDLLRSMIGGAFPDGLRVPARFVVEPGEPATVLVQLSAEAERVVIGARTAMTDGVPPRDGAVRRCLEGAWCPVDVCEAGANRERAARHPAAAGPRRGADF